MATPKFVFLDGRIIPYNDARVGILTHGLNYGTGVFGGLRGYWSEEENELFVFRPHDHYKRFLESAKLLRMQLPYTKELLTDHTMDVIRMNGFRQDCYIRPLAFYGDEIIGVRLHDLTPRVAISALPFGRYIEKEDGAHVTVSSWCRVNDNTIPPRGKIVGAYVNSALLKSDAQLAGFDEAIVLNSTGHVSEGSAENLFLVRNDVVITPSVSEDILEGIVRRSLIVLIQEELGMQVVERCVDRTELFLADEVFLAGTGVQIAAITRIDFRPIGSGHMGQLTARLRELYFNVVRGKIGKYRHWCLPVYSSAEQPEEQERSQQHAPTY